MTTQSKQYLTCAETAKLVRVALKSRWPHVKFSVRSSVYAGGASIDVSWNDGPSTKEVDPITQQFTGASFDALIDLKSYHASEWQGQQVHFGADYIFTNRHISNLETVTEVVMLMLRRYYTVSPGVYPNYDMIGTRTVEDMAHQIIRSRKESETLEEALKS